MFHLLSFFVCLFCFALNFDVNYSSSLHDSKRHLCHDSDSLSLLQFKYSFTTINNSGYRQFDCPGAYPKTKSWKEGVDCCKWQGVKCDIISGHVIGLDLSYSFLMGRLESNTSLFQLHALQSINLAYNNFSSSHISPKFSLFPHLEHLNLSSSGFLGQVPFEIAHLRQLKSLDLSRNLYLFTNFSSITHEMSNVNKVIENLTHLEELDLSFVQLNSIFPKSLSNLSSLTSLQLYNSGLRGNLSAHVFDLPHLRVLRLGGNDELHVDVSQLNLSSCLEVLDLSSLSFPRELPHSLRQSTSLKKLSLSYCNLHGFIPNWIWNVTERIDLSNNNFVGEIPKYVNKKGLSSLTIIDLSGNMLKGTIPSWLFTLPSLTGMDLSSNQFSSTLHEFAIDNSPLQDINLSGNLLHGTIPSSLFNLPSLTAVSLGTNQFIGQLSELVCNCSSLTQINLGDNLLNGTVPSCLFYLPSLFSINLKSNRFTGELNRLHCNLTTLAIINLSHNLFNGEIPPCLFALPFFSTSVRQSDQFTGQLDELSSYSSTKSIDLSANNFSGTIEICMFSKLKKVALLDLSWNNLSLATTSCNVTSNSDWSSLMFLYLSSCNLSEVPQSLKTAKNLVQLDLSYNKIHGDIPKWMQEIGNGQIEYLNLSHNFLVGGLEHLPWETLKFVDVNSNLLREPIPPSICNNLDELDIVNLSHNNLNGDIPPCLGNFSSISILDLRSNSLRGIIPTINGECKRLTNLELNGNQLVGSLPKSLIQCKNLEVLDLGNNKLNDTFPYWLSSLSELQILVLRSNNMFGTIQNPKHNYSFPSLRILDLSNNFFIGTLPTRLLRNLNAMKEAVEKKGNLQYMEHQVLRNVYYQDSITLTFKDFTYSLDRIFTILTTIDISCNAFEGEIPDIIGNLISLKYLNLSHNNFNHSIPPSLGNLTALESFDLSFNKLVGHIPRDLVDLTSLGVFNVSYNELNGPIPQGMKFPNDSYIGNQELCGIPMSKKCEEGNQEASQPMPSSETSKDEGVPLEWEAIMMGFGCGMVGGLSAGYIMFSIGRPLWLMKLADYLESVSLRRSRKNRAQRL